MSRGLDVPQGDLVAFLRERKTASLGGVFAAQVAEHLPAARSCRACSPRPTARCGPAACCCSRRSTRARSRASSRSTTATSPTSGPLHPDTLRFLAAAAGFTDVRVEMKSEVEPAARPSAGARATACPRRTAAALNENVERLNALLYGPLEYALLAASG